jgi:hypothetical protein
LSESEVYGGLVIEPQIGLVPIGADPESGLWEFWHTESGMWPLRDGATGKVTMSGDTGLCFCQVGRSGWGLSRRIRRVLTTTQTRTWNGIPCTNSHYPRSFCPNSK